MNRIILIGNGFDLAHGLKTKYEDFINWYWDQRVLDFINIHKNISRDELCEFRIEEPYDWCGFYYQINSVLNKICGKDVINKIIANDYGVNMKYVFSPFFDNIIKCVETKGWVDIENEYYHLLTKYAISEPSQEGLAELNIQLQYIQDLLAKYLNDKFKLGITEL